MLHVCHFMLCMDCESEIKIYYYWKMAANFVTDQICDGPIAKYRQKGRLYILITGEEYRDTAISPAYNLLLPGRGHIHGLPGFRTERP